LALMDSLVALVIGIIPPLKMLALGPMIATLAIWSKRG